MTYSFCWNLSLSWLPSVKRHRSISLLCFCISCSWKDWPPFVLDCLFNDVCVLTTLEGRSSVFLWRQWKACYYHKRFYSSTQGFSYHASHCMCRHPSGYIFVVTSVALVDKGNWCKYVDTHAARCAMSNTVLCLRNFLSSAFMTLW